MLIYLLAIDDPKDRELFSDLYIKYKKSMLWKANRMLKDKGDAEDAVHDAFMGIAKNMDIFHKVDNPKSYVLTCTENAAFKILEKRKAIVVDIEEELKDYPDYDEENRVVQCINSLPKNDREILKLYDLYGLSLKEAAKILRISESNARKHHERAKGKLEELCKQEALL